MDSLQFLVVNAFPAGNLIFINLSIFAKVPPIRSSLAYYLYNFENTGYDVCRSNCGDKDSTAPCTFGVSYAEGSSLSGIILEDHLQLENQDQSEGIITTFGCTTK